MENLRIEELHAIDVQMLIEQAVKWWEGNRPANWSLEQHLAQPTVNCETDEDDRLAKAAAEVVKQRLGLESDPECPPSTV